MSPPDQGAGLEEPIEEPRLQPGTDLPAENRLLPGIFLMINSFETGGSERQFVTLAKSLDPTRFRLQLGCIMPQGSFLQGFGEVPKFGLGGSLYRWKSGQTRLRLARHLRRNQVAVAHAFDFYTNLTMIPAARLAGVPVVVGSHRQLGDLLTPIQWWVQLAMFRWCDAVVCNSQAAAAKLLAAGLPERKVVVIGNGLSPSALAETPPALPRISGKLRVGMIARMNTRSKNHRLFLGVATRLCAKFPGLEFVLVGDGPLRPELEREADQLGLTNQVTFLGDRRDIPALLASLDVSVLPSVSESLSNVILESMAAGLPVVANRVGGNTELLEGNRGVLVEQNSEQVFAQAVERLLCDARLRHEIGRQAREFVQANFTIENMRMRHEELYEELLQRKKWRAKSPHSKQPRLRGTDRVLRVAIIAASPRYVGGQSVQADLLLGNWQCDAEVEASFTPIDPPLPPPLAWAEHVPGLRTAVRLPFYLATLWRGLAKVDIAHIFSASYWSFILAPLPAWIVARLRGKKVLIHYHSGEARDHLRRFPTARSVLARADKLVVPSRYLIDVFKEFGLQAEVVPNIVDLSQFSFRMRDPLRPNLVCTRGFHPYYGVDVVVRAFAKVKEVFPAAQLDLVGGGPSELEIRELVRKMNLSVTFTGVCAWREMGQVYDRADIFINASRLDNMPVSILEAFASGTPVISTAPESIPYFVDDGRTGLLSRVDDAEALAQNVIRVLRDPALASRLAHNAYEQSQQYQWVAVREQWMKVYRTLGLPSRQASQEFLAPGSRQSRS